MIMKGSDIVIHSLLSHGIRIAAGIPGGAVLPLYDALRKSGIRHILARNEQGAGFIAQGIARSTGTCAVCIATSGPGATNLVTPLADAFHDSVPLIAITGQVSRSLIGHNSFQEIDIVSVCAPVTKLSRQIPHAGDIASAVEEAFFTALHGKKGPVLLDIPRDVFLEECEYIAPDRRKEHEPEIPEEKISAAAEIINRSKRPLILAGGGAASPEEEQLVRALAAKNSIPSAHTLMGKGVLPDNDALNIGLAGMHGNAFVHRIIEESDCLIIIGSRLSDRVTGKPGTFARGKKIIRIDIGTALTYQSVQPDIEVNCGIKNALPLLIQLIDKNSRCEWIKKTSADRLSCRFTDLREENSPEDLAKIIAGYADDGTIICTDVGQHQFWTAKNCSINRSGQFITSGGFGTMGFGLPAAIGCAAANPGKRIICACGDGSILMNIQELALAAELNLDIKIIVFNNRHLGLVRQQQELFWNKRYSACSYDKPHNFAAIAEGFGIRGFSVNGGNFSDITPLLGGRGPALFDVTINESSNIFPIVPPGLPNTETMEHGKNGFRKIKIRPEKKGTAQAG